MNEQYKITEEFRLEYNMNHIMNKRVLLFDRIELYINPQYISIYGYPSSDSSNTPELVYITNKFIPITKQVLLNAMQLDVNERYYIGYGDLLVDSRSYINASNLTIINTIQSIFQNLNMECEEFMDWICNSLTDYLLLYPEDRVM